VTDINKGIILILAYSNGKGIVNQLGILISDDRLSQMQVEITDDRKV